ncbi:hypothetical protein MZM54_03745 [[Brevibacterium] frigoritolerans]|nr:hypothetical protein [Peribacillus frigoritolerans]
MGKEWKHRPNVDHHIFGELYNMWLDSNKDELLEVIQKTTQDRWDFLKEDKEKRVVGDGFREKMVDEAIKIYYFKFINKNTRIED